MLGKWKACWKFFLYIIEIASYKFIYTTWLHAHLLRVAAPICDGNNTKKNGCTLGEKSPKPLVFFFSDVED